MTLLSERSESVNMTDWELEDLLFFINIDLTKFDAVGGCLGSLKYMNITKQMLLDEQSYRKENS